MEAKAQGKLRNESGYLTPSSVFSKTYFQDKTYKI